MIIEFAEVVALLFNCIHVVILVTSFATCRCRAGRWAYSACLSIVIMCVCERGLTLALVN